jgi:hypothetical protein
MPFAKYDESDYALPVSRIGNADYGDFEHSRMTVNWLLHFLRRNVVTAPNDDLLFAAIEPEIPI